VLLFRNYGNSILILIIIGFSIVFNWMITFFLRSKERESLAVRNLFV
jgi:UDP-GlcNAc:undecaprenyl-phosphate GlcNAc-1-phosphate transferase